MSLRTLAQALAFSRVAYGTQLLLAPALAGRVWVGRRAAALPATALFARGLGARDLAMGAGALLALRSGDDEHARRWMAGQVVSDSADLFATLAAGRSLPAGPRRFAAGMAGVSALVAAAAAIGLGRDSTAAPAPA